jgi:hypothetical protein
MYEVTCPRHNETPVLLSRLKIHHTDWSLQHAKLAPTMSYQAMVPSIQIIYTVRLTLCSHSLLWRMFREFE